MKLFAWILFGIIILLGIIIIAIGIFDVITFLGVLFYILLYAGGFYYIKVGIDREQKELQIMEGRKQKFEWCWERINKILKGMPGGQGLQWAKGIGRRSYYKTFFDGVQNKPFRSILAHLENTQQIVMVIYDIDGDDIASFVTNPPPEYYDNPFIDFKPFMRGGVGPGYQEGRYDYDPYAFGHGRTPRRKGSGVSIHVGGDEYGDFDEMANKVKPSSDVINKAKDKLQGEKK